MSLQRAGFVAATLLLAACQKPVGKDALREDQDLRNQVLRDCADGTHINSQECSNAKAVDNADKLERSLGSK
ncbi:hypothetical protein SAMN05518849_11465 [Sphingobium sp. AP50]|nr:hypothetical protein SAMN05518849_11465 [Sphingobium sp. AP50]